MRIYQFLLLILISLVLGSAPAGANSDSEDTIACQSQSIPRTNPIFENVEKINIMLDILPPNFEEKIKSIPNSLKMSEIGKKLKYSYEKRFSTHNGKIQQTNTPGCYGRADQKAELYYFASDQNPDDKYWKETKSAGVLSVYFIGRFISMKESNLNSDIFAFSISHIRSEIDYTSIDIRALHNQPLPHIVVLGDNKLEKKLNSILSKPRE